MLRRTVGTFDDSPSGFQRGLLRTTDEEAHIIQRRQRWPGFRTRGATLTPHHRDRARNAA